MDIGTQMRLTGLATGLDTDEVIRNMGRVHNLRIDAVNRERQLAVWRQEIYRSTIDMLSGFQKSKFNFANPTSNFRSVTAFSKFTYNLSLGGSAEAAAKIMSVTANGELKNFNQSVQAVAQLATKDTWNGSKNLGMQGMVSKGFDLDNFANKSELTTSQKTALDKEIYDTLRDSFGVEFDTWRDVSANLSPGSEFDTWYDGQFNEWYDKQFDEWFKEKFEDWFGINGSGYSGIDDPEALDDFLVYAYSGDMANARDAFLTDVYSDDIANARDEFLTDVYSGDIANAWNEFRDLEVHWNNFLDTKTAEVEQVRDELTEKYINANATTFEYALIGISIDNVTRTITLTNEELKKIYVENDTAQERAQAFADLFNQKVESIYGKEFNKIMTVTPDGELKIDKLGSNITVFEDTGFDSLKRMGFKSGASNVNFSGKTAVDFFPDLFTQAVQKGTDRQVFVDKDGTQLFRIADDQLIDKDNRQVFIDKDGNSVFRTGVDTYVDVNRKSVAAANVVGPLSISDDDVKPLYNDTTISISGKSIVISAADTVSSMISKINNSGAGVTLTYDAVDDRFVLASVGEGSINNIHENTYLGERKTDGSLVLTSTGVFLNALGIVTYDAAGGDDGKGKIDYYNREEGKNLRAFINGQEITKFSNTFTMDGMSYTFHETFNSSIVYNHTYKDDGFGNEIIDVEDKLGTIDIIDAKEEIKIRVNKNTDDIISNIKEFVDEYNKIIEHINGLMYEKRDREYPPLTEEQKKAMKEEEIKAWEEKAKAGIVGGDMELRRLLDQLRKAVYEPVEGAGISMSEIGIGTTHWRDGGRLSIDEGKLREALESNYDNVVRLFTKSSDIPYGQGDQAQRYKENGMANRLNDIISDAVRTTTIDGKKGYMVEKAGVLNDGSTMNNQITKQIEQHDKRIAVLIERWKRQEKSYYQMFARMETAMMKLQGQQNNLASLMAQNG